MLCDYTVLGYYDITFDKAKSRKNIFFTKRLYYIIRLLHYYCFRKSAVTFVCAIGTRLIFRCTNIRFTKLVHNYYAITFPYVLIIMIRVSILCIKVYCLYTWCSQFRT